MNNLLLIAFAALAVVILGLMVFFYRRRSAVDTDASEEKAARPEPLPAAPPTHPASKAASETTANATAVGAKPAENAASAHGDTDSGHPGGQEAEPAPVDVNIGEAAASAETPAPTYDHPEFARALAEFESELRAGHFSRLDVFAEFEQLADSASAKKTPRSKYFHDVVSAALVYRDALEGLLCDEDRERFIDVHSRYLDDVSHEPDEEIRQERLQEHLDLLRGLRPRDDEAPLVERKAG